ncbi:MAG: hypothetical protein V1843_00675, partial [bacterium]
VKIFFQTILGLGFVFFMSTMIFAQPATMEGSTKSSTIEAQPKVKVVEKIVEKIIVKKEVLPPLLFNVPLKKIYVQPDTNSKVVFEIPFDFMIVETTPDERWVKIRAEYDFLGHHVVEGWGRVRQ